MKKVLAGLALVSVAGLTAGCSSQNEKIVIYSNAVDGGHGEWLTEQAKEAGFDIECVSVPGGELGERLIAEKNNATADMVFGLNAIEFSRLKDEELLTKYKPTWASDVDMTIGDVEGYFYPITVVPLTLAGNDRVEMPSDWTDLTQDQYKDRYAIFKLSGNTAKTILASIACRYPDENGEFGVSDEGWEVVKKYIQNGVVVDGKERDFVGDVISEDDPLDYMMIWGQGLFQFGEQRDYTFQYMKPEIGVPYVTEQVGILNTTDKEEKVKEFIDWFGSAEVQGGWSKEFGSIPANQVALEGIKPEIREFEASLHPQEIDWDFVSKHLADWVEKVELEFMQ
ncbi:iron(III) transport system substrate-binding protein [Granulicatella balaenopterae]|uniref:Iron(III) transport system substrate-binding protein n=1 Tax=Granulicatella balaenopterae TaxID=137733 RepID=A0A1H9HVM7_9LACT|nr:extracellular solute-binding protein [Granulicatella balaenopterae]SEQ66399.1 iron(III) transport system substrate-binding protein [Granulicatella balaenopterae]